ncbi:MAG: HAMP domain-containing sensor histidine kinase [Negativicutes bacterium]|nr:HAMP domain-containing sensor histidine kinase [Negativicutes bacterium]
MGKGKIIRLVAGIILLLAVYVGCIAGAFFLTLHFIAISPETLSPVYIQIINSLLGLFWAILLFGLFQMRHMAQIKQAFAAITEALEKISQGDFTIRLNLGFRVSKEVKELMNNVNKMALELNQMEKMRQDFISNVSHEIQSPLTSIRGFAQALHNNQLSTEDRLRFINIIETESIRLSELSDSMLKLASLEAENSKIIPGAYRLDKQIKNSILACEPQWTEKKIEIEVLLDQLEIKADESLMSQVWINLIHNSIKFTPEDGTIRVELRRQGENAVCRISDTGIGMTEEDLLHIFERFYKADKARERSQQGNGLGLSIVKKIIDMHQGIINVESTLGKGTTFTVILPL